MSSIDDWERALENLSFLSEQQLRDILQTNDEDTEGSYQELFDRVREFLRANPDRRRTIFSEYPDSFNSSSKTTVKNTSGTGQTNSQEIYPQQNNDNSPLQNYPAYSTPDMRRTLHALENLLNMNSNNTPFQFQNIPSNFHLPQFNPNAMAPRTPLSITHTSENLTQNNAQRQNLAQQDVANQGQIPVQNQNSFNYQGPMGNYQGNPGVPPQQPLYNFPPPPPPPPQNLYNQPPFYPYNMPQYQGYNPYLWQNQQPHPYYGYNAPYERIQNPQVNETEQYINERARRFTNIIPEYNNIQQEDLRRKIQIDTLLDKKNIKFSGKSSEDPEDFLKKLNDAARSLALSKIDIFKNLSSVLTEDAADWFDVRKSQWNNYDDFIYAFMRFYGKQDPQEKYTQQAKNRRQAKGEDMLSFVTAMMKIFSKFEPQLNLSFMLDMTYDNLHLDYVRHIKRSQFRSFEQLLDIGREVEIQGAKIKNLMNEARSAAAKSKTSNAAASEVKISATPVNSPQNNNNAAKQNKKGAKPNNASNKAQSGNEKQNKGSNNNSVNTNTKAPQNQQSQTSSQPVNTTKQSNQTQAQPNISSTASVKLKPDNPQNSGNFQKPLNSQKSCYNCGKPGHLFVECRAPKKDYFCYICGEKGVITRTCPKNHPTKQEN